jgi:transcriptional regulator with XRE-family HTH domain
MNQVEYKIKLLLLGKTQKEIAEQYGCTRQWINEIVNQKVKCDKFDRWLNSLEQPSN